MSVRAPPTVLQPGVAASAASLTPEQRLRQQAELAELAFGSAEFSAARLSSTQHLAFLPPEELALDLEDPQQRELGDYTLLEKLGQGGMGVVYRARQNPLDREVAIKLLAAGPWASRDFIERFRREAQSAARMQHPNIVGIYEIGRHDELNFFSMRLVRGPSLAHLLAESGPMPPRAAAQLLRTVAEAVDYAHRLGVLHLDLKPGNVLIDETGVPLVADFGLARRMDETLGHDTDEVSGTPSYMAPEQAQLKSHRLSAATDIYGLGAIGFEMLAGRPPFQGDSPHDTLLRVVTQPAPSLRDARPGVPADLAAIVGKCLAKEPEQRYASARALADDLARFLDGRAVSVRVPSWHERLGRWARRDPRLAIAASALLATLVTGIVATSFQWKRAESNAAASRALLWEGRREAALRLEQDGRGYDAMAQLLANLREAEDAGAAVDATIDRQRLGLIAAGGATLIDTAVIADSNPFAVAVSPDGARVAIAFGDLSVRWYDAATLVERGRVSLASRTTSDRQRRPPVLLRFVDAQHLLVTLEWYANLTSPNEGDSWLVDLAHGAVVDPPAAFADFADAVYSADARLAVLRNHHRGVQLWQVSPWRPLGPLQTGNDLFQPWFVDPHGRFCLEMGVALREVHVRAQPTLAPIAVVTTPSGLGVSAWALSGDGRRLALGDFEGGVFLVDTTDWSLRTLPAARGREITWLAFSDDDGWLASASFDGTVQAFDVATGDPLTMGRMQAEFAPRRVAIDEGERLLVASGVGRAALWRLPAPGPRAVPAQRIGLGPAAHGLAGPYPVGWSLPHRLLATAGMDGQVRLYRLPPAPMRPGRAARQLPDTVPPDPRWLVETDWNHVRVVSLRHDAPGPWRTLAQPPGYAEVLDGRLVATVGPTLAAFNVPALAPAFAPIDLPASPQRIAPSPDGRRVLLDFGEHGIDGFVDHLRVVDVRTGRLLPGEARIDGPVRHFAWSPDGARVLAVGRQDGATTVLRAADLHVVRTYDHDPFEPVLWAAFEPQGDAVRMVTRTSDPRFGGDELLRWHPDTDTLDAPTTLPRTQPLGVLAAPAGTLVAGQERDLWWPHGRGAPLVLARHNGSEPLALAAASPDGRLLARAFRREVQLYDTASGAVVGLPLATNAQALDAIADLGFAEGGRQLRARTVLGANVVWPLPVERHPLAQLTDALARLDLDRESQTVVRMPGARERAALRAADPGLPMAMPSAPPLAGTGRAMDGSIVPPRSPSTPATAIALDSEYTNGPEDVRNTFYSILPTLRPYPAGLQRIGDADFDLRGQVQIGSSVEFGARPDKAMRARMALRATTYGLRCLPVPADAIAAVHLLLRPSLRTPLPTGKPLMTLTLHYADGGTVTLPLRAGVELPGYSGDDAAVHEVFATEVGTVVYGFESERISAPRVPNPEPARVVRCLDLDTLHVDTPVALLGLTVEPVAGAAPAVP